MKEFFGNQHINTLFTDNGDIECLDILLRQGADVNHTTIHGWTALFHAAREFN